MRSPERVLNSLVNHNSDEKYRYERIYRILYNPEMYLIAYQKIYANKGSMTKGIDGKTIDGMSMKRIENLIMCLKDESYQPMPAKRVYISKKDGGKRPLGIPSSDDKLLQEVIRMILEAIYEGTFEASSHGSRSNKSCHTALKDIQVNYTGIKWFIEGDIEKFFDKIDHSILISLLQRKINDERFIRLIRKFLKAGYMEEWIYHKTYSGAVQGGIISPILANVYLNELDRYMKEYAERFNTGKERKRNPEYRKLETKRGALVRQLDRCTDESEKQDIKRAIREIEKERVTIPYGIAMDENFKRIKYVRYVDDFLIGVIGSKEDSKKIKEDIRHFLREKLSLNLSEKKTLITHANKPAKFLGYNIYIRKSNLPKRDKLGRLKRDYVGRVVLSISTETIRNKLLNLRAVKIMYVDGKEIWKPKARYSLKDSDDLEILNKYNTEIRGFYNYYSIANNSSVLHHFKYIMEYSMYKTFATKYRTSKSKVIDKYRINKDFGVRYTTKSGNEKIRLFYNEGFKRKTQIDTNSNIDLIRDPITHLSSTSLIDRLKANKCEMCNSMDKQIEIHHVHKLKDLKGKKYWERYMIARNRKTLALCYECHQQLHAGKLD